MYRAADHIPDPLTHITPREREILFLLATGMGQHGVARVLYCSRQTVKCHLARLYQRWAVSRLESALVRALAAGVFTQGDMQAADRIGRERAAAQEEL